MTKRTSIMESKDGIKAVYAKDRKAWRKWLQQNSETEKSVWLIVYHQKSTTPSVYYNEAVEEALCFGWIDSRSNKRDEESSYLYFSRRKSKSNWSAANKERVARLMAQGLVTEKGLAVIEEAKKNGAWTALDSADALQVPADLQIAFAKNKTAESCFNRFSPSAKKRILTWINSAKREETRAKRIAETVGRAEKNEKVC